MNYDFRILEDYDWEASPIVEIEPFETEEGAIKYGQALANKNGKEVRVNRSDSFQGHYCRPFPAADGQNGEKICQCTSCGEDGPCNELKDGMCPDCVKMLEDLEEDEDEE